MSTQEETKRILIDFYTRKINRINIYLPGFGGLFVGRTKEGLSIGYLDKGKRFGHDDHSTVLFDKEGIKSIHRTVSDDYSVVYMKPNVDYIVQGNGTRSILQDIQQRGKMPLPAKIVWMMVFRTLNWASDSGDAISKNVATLTEKQANELGMDSPCLYIEPQVSQRLIIPLFSVLIKFQSYANSRMFNKRPTSGFIPGDFPGLITTKHTKRKTKKANKRVKAIAKKKNQI